MDVALYSLLSELEVISETDFMHALVSCGIEVENIDKKNLEITSSVCGEIVFCDENTLTINVGAKDVKVKNCNFNLRSGNKVLFLQDLGNDFDGKIVCLDLYKKSVPLLLDVDAVVGENIFSSLDTRLISLSFTPDIMFAASICGVVDLVSSISSLKRKHFESKITKEIERLDLSIDFKNKNYCNAFFAILINNDLESVSLDVYLHAALTGNKYETAVEATMDFFQIYLGQPVFVYDFDKIKTKSLVIRNANDLDKIKINSSVLDLNNSDVVLSFNEEIISISGISSADNFLPNYNTKQFLCEIACYDAESVCKVCRAHNLINYRSKMFSSFLKPSHTKNAFNFICEHLNSSQIRSSLILDSKKDTDKKIDFDPDIVERLLGIKMSRDDIYCVLKDLGFDVLKGEKYVVNVPFYRSDINIQEDVVDQILRRSFVDSIFANDFTRFSVGKQIEDPFFQKCKDLRSRCVGLGLFECINLDIVEKRILLDFESILLHNQKFATFSKKSSQSLCLRHSILPSILESANKSMNEGYENVRLFEIGKVYCLQDNFHNVSDQLCILMSGFACERFWEDSESRKIDFFDVFGVVENIFPDLSCKPSNYCFLQKGVQAKLIFNKEEIGFIGKLESSKRDIFVVQIDLKKVLVTKSFMFKSKLNFPTSSRDETFDLPLKVMFEEVKEKIALEGLLLHFELISIFSPTNASIKKMTFRFVYGSNQKTLSKNEVDLAHKKVCEAIFSISS